MTENCYTRVEGNDTMKKLCACLLAASCLAPIAYQTPISMSIIAASDKSTYKQGYDDGYAYEKEHANTKFTQKSGSDEYKRGYQAGWYKAYDEYMDEATKSAIDAANNDFEIKKKNKTKCPSEIKFKSEWRKIYKETYADLEENAVDNLQDLAEENAKKDCFNRLGRHNTLDSLKKTSEKEDYRKFYNDAYNNFNKDLTQAKKDVVTDGKEDAKAGRAASYVSINSYRGYVVYDDLVKLYNEAYEKAGGTITASSNDNLRWKYENNVWKCYNVAGELVKNKWVASYNNWYYADKDGMMKTGWLASGEYWYYFDGSGKMVTGSRWIDSQMMRFDNNGKWLKS